MNEELENGQQERVSPAAAASSQCVNLLTKGAKIVDDILRDIRGIFGEVNQPSKLYQEFLKRYKDNLETDINAILLSGYDEEEEAAQIRRIHAKYETQGEALMKKSSCGSVLLVGFIGIAGIIWGIVSFFKGKNPGNGSTLNFMTMNDLVKGVSVTPELEHHYVEVERAIGELEYLKKHCLEEEKTEAEELLKLLCGLHYALKALIFKDSHISPRTFQNRVRSLRKLLEEVGYGDNNPRLNKLLHDACNAEVSPQLRQQAREILEAINGKKS